MRPCEICGRPGQCHHIVFKSQGGMNIELNYAWLCNEHHTQGEGAVHRCRSFDLLLKIRVQRRLESLFREPEYGIPEVAKLVGCDRRRLAMRMRKVPKKCGKYMREDIIRFFMGGKLYTELMPPQVERKTAGDPAEGFIFLEEQT